MFRPTCRSSSPFSMTDLDMWDTRSRFAAQTSAWSSMAAVSGTGFQSKVSTSSCGSAGGLRQNDPGLRKWQSLSHLEPEAATCSFSASPGAELRAARGERSFRHTEVGQWMQDAHERLDSQFNSLRNRHSHLSYNKTATHLLDMKHQEKESAEFSQFEISRQRGELHEKVIQLEKELLQMRSSLGRGGSDQTAEKTPVSHGKTFASSPEDLNKPESEKVDPELHKLKEALREAETKAKTQEEERKRALQKLQTSIETQSTLLNQIEEMNQRLSNTRQDQSEVQEQLREANNKISQACLEKATLLTQVMKLEDNIKVLMGKLAEDQSEKDKLIKEKADLHQKNQALDLQLERTPKGSEGSEDSESSNNKEDEEKVWMREESKALREVNEKLTNELEMTKEKLMTSQFELQEMAAERDVLSKQVTELKSESSQLVREKDELLSKVREGGHEELREVKEKCCQLRESVEALQSEKLKLQDQCLCLEAKALEKEEKLQLQEEEYKRQDALRVQAFQEQKAVASHWTDKWQKVALTLRATQEELEELKKNIVRNGNDSDSLLKAQLDACQQEPERSRSRVQLHGCEGGEALQTQDSEAVTDLSESSLLLEAPSDSQANKNKTSQVKDEKSSEESKTDKTVFQINPQTDQQRRLVTEQLKSLFKERGGKEVQTVDNSSGGAQTGAPSTQDRSQKIMRKAGDRRIWQHGSGLMPVFEEDEESGDCSGGEDGELIKLPTEMFDHTVKAGIINLKAEHENLLQAALVCEQQTAENISDTSCDVTVPNIPNYSAESSPQTTRPPPIYPDGIFLAELVEICSPDEDEDEEEGVD